MTWLKAAAIVSAFYGVALVLLFGLKISGTLAVVLGGIISVPGIFISMPFGGVHSGTAFVLALVLNWCFYVSLVRYFIVRKRTA